MDSKRGIAKYLKQSDLNTRSKTNGESWDWWLVFPTHYTDEEIRECWPIDVYGWGPNQPGSSFAWGLSIKRTSTRVLAKQHGGLDI